MARAKDLGVKNRNQKKTKKPPMKPSGGKSLAGQGFLKGTKPRGVKP